MDSDSVRPYVWRTDFELGIPLIDDQHRVLVKMINEAHHRLNGDPSAAEVSEIVNGLLSYADYHFETEERYAVEYGYDRAHGVAYAEHISEHRAFARDVADVARRLAAGERVETPALLTYLRRWLTDHILELDRRIGDFAGALD
ncbi:bacteriohemerythrin [Propionivibrio dicarboxylicus]|uniref:Hemerythrin n=1 Tax=Propionivibrio dicarboxylicus TaxID=83767 RepID=A0A1G8I3L3_9RHOO|nr:bacteriohemerythrin [Propionivibrio dicarboxylicus]SDI13230.1 hemerythrin [Propionivibrio dicarboxylicus]